MGDQGSRLFSAFMSTTPSTATLLLSCRDQPGLVATVSDFVYRNGGNILHADQHTDAEERVFLQRVEWDLDGFGVAHDDIRSAFGPVAERFGMQWSMHISDNVHRLAVLVSRQGHCMYDLLARWKMGELAAEIPLVISNHEDHGDSARAFGATFHHLAIDAATRSSQEEAVEELIGAHGVDTIVLARYMQILSPEFVGRHPNKIINIHHSFLPAFAGARPYNQAHERGVKIIGATAHYVTAELDEGPIIAQDVAGVSHRDSVEDLVHKGRDLETVVLARAVRLHLQHRVLVYGHKTVVFD